MRNLKKYIAVIILCLSHSLAAQIDISLNLTWEDNTFPNNPYHIEFDKLDRPYFYVANDNGGVRIYKDLDNSDPIQVNQIHIDEWDSLNVMNLNQNGNYLYLALGSFFTGQDFGIAVVDITIPEDPMVTDFWTYGTPVKGSASVVVEGDYAYLSAMSAGMFIFNISNPTDIQFISSLIPDPDFPIANPTSSQEPNARAIAVKDNVAFIAYDAGGIRAIDISNRGQPLELGIYINEQILGKTQQAYNDLLIFNNLGFITTDYCGIEIIDLTDPSAMTPVGEWNPWHCETADNNWFNSPGHTNQLGFLPGHEGKLLLVNANDIELIVLDVSDPKEIKSIYDFGEEGDNLRTWGLGISENKIAGVYYTTLLPWLSLESKIKLFDFDIITNIKTLENKQILVFPNPTLGLINILSDENINRVEIRIYNVLGQEVHFQHLSGLSRTKFDLSAILASGYYYLKLIYPGNSETHKILLTK